MFPLPCVSDSTFDARDANCSRANSSNKLTTEPSAPIATAKRSGIRQRNRALALVCLEPIFHRQRLARAFDLLENGLYGRPGTADRAKS